jgi:prepilin-type N-terminal cleavage/methylation domain-containing protein
MNQLRSKKGLTLIEMLIVIAIIGILASAAIPNYSRWKEKYEIDGETKKVYFDLSLAHSTSISNNHNVIVIFDPDNHTYKVHGDRNNDEAENFGEDIKSVNLENRMEFGFFGNALLDVDGNPVLRPISFASNGNTITFNSRGQASTSGSIFLIHKNDIGISNNRLRSINIIQSTGSIESLELTGEGFWR